MSKKRKRKIFINGSDYGTDIDFACNLIGIKPKTVYQRIYREKLKGEDEYNLAFPIMKGKYIIELREV